MIIKGQAPASATLLTDDEMRNIKALWHITKVEHSYWTPGYWYPTVKWVTRSFSYPTIKLRWVPGYYLWGWIPVPGHYEPYVAWKKASINVPTIIWKYQKPRKKTYYTYQIVPDNPNAQKGPYINLGKPIKFALGIAAWKQGVEIIAGSVGADCIQPELTPLTYFSLSFGIFEIGFGTYQVWDAADDPLYSNKSYENQILENWRSWLL